MWQPKKRDQERSPIASAHVSPSFAREKRFIDASRNLLALFLPHDLPHLLAMTRPLRCSDGRSKLAYCAGAYACLSLSVHLTPPARTSTHHLHVDLDTAPPRRHCSSCCGFSSTNDTRFPQETRAPAPAHAPTCGLRLNSPVCNRLDLTLAAPLCTLATQFIPSLVSLQLQFALREKRRTGGLCTGWPGQGEIPADFSPCSPLVTLLFLSKRTREDDKEDTLLLQTQGREGCSRQEEGAELLTSAGTRLLRYNGRSLCNENVCSHLFYRLCTR